MAQAEQFWPDVQGQRLSAGERPRRPHIPTTGLLADCAAHNSELAPRELRPRGHRQSRDREYSYGRTVDNPRVRPVWHGHSHRGTLAKNISFLLVPSADNAGAFHFESANVRFSNLFKSGWVNVKVGKFELDNIISENAFSRSRTTAVSIGFTTSNRPPRFLP